MSVMVAFSVTPVGDDAHVGELVAEAVRVVRQSGLANRTDPMFTVVEGDDLDEVMPVVNAAIAAVAQHCQRVSATVKIDYFPGRGGDMDSKVAAVEEYLATD